MELEAPAWPEGIIGADEVVVVELEAKQLVLPGILGRIVIGNHGRRREEQRRRDTGGGEEAPVRPLPPLGVHESSGIGGTSAKVGHSLHDLRASMWRCRFPRRIPTGSPLQQVGLAAGTGAPHPRRCGTMTKRTRLLIPVLPLAVVLGLAPSARAAQFPEARIFIEYNSTDGDLGFHVSLDAEDWRRVSITNPAGLTIFQVEGKGAFGDLGLSELFTEGAEPLLSEVPLPVLFARMPEGRYTFRGVTVNGRSLLSRAMLSHAVPAGPAGSTLVSGDTVIISWEPVTGPPAGFPNRAVTIVGYQVIVGSFQITLPGSSTSMRLPDELIASLGPGEHG